VPIGTVVNGQFYCLLLQEKFRPVVRHKQPELLERGVTLLKDSAAPHHHDVRNLLYRRGWNVLAHDPALQISHHVITGCLHTCKNIFGVNDLNQMMIATLLSLPLYIV
jgi:hypothetical protein